MSGGARLYRKLRQAAQVVPALTLAGGAIWYFVDSHLDSQQKKVERSLEIHKKFTEPYFSERLSILYFFNKEFDTTMAAISKNQKPESQNTPEIQDKLVAFLKQNEPGKSYSREEALISLLSLVDNARECVKRDVCDETTAVNLIGPIACNLHDPFVFYVHWMRGVINDAAFGEGMIYFRNMGYRALRPASCNDRP